jgi:hypothetical protein
VRDRDDPSPPEFTVRQEERRRWMLRTMLRTMPRRSERAAQKMYKDV